MGKNPHKPTFRLFSRFEDVEAVTANSASGSFYEDLERLRKEVLSAKSTWSDYGTLRDYASICFWAIRKLEYGFITQRFSEIAASEDRRLDVLDVGSGVVPLCNWVSAQGHRVFAIDSLVQDFLVLADLGVNRFFDSATSYQVARAEQLPFSDAAVDVVTCASVLEHALPGNDHLAVAEMARVLRPGGNLLISFDIAPVRDRAEGERPTPPERRIFAEPFTPAQVRRLVNVLGQWFDVEIESIPAELDTLEWDDVRNFWRRAQKHDRRKAEVRDYLAIGVSLRRNDKPVEIAGRDEALFEGQAALLERVDFFSFHAGRRLEKIEQMEEARVREAEADQSHFSNLRTELESIATEAEKRLENLNEATTEAERLREEISRIRAREGELASSARGRIETLQSERIELDQKCVKLQEECAELGAEHLKMREERTELDRECVKLQEEITKLDAEHTKVLEDRSRLQADLAEEQVGRERLAQDMSVATRQAEILKERIEKAEDAQRKTAAALLVSEGELTTVKANLGVVESETDRQLEKSLLLDARLETTTRSLVEAERSLVEKEAIIELVSRYQGSSLLFWMHSISHKLGLWRIGRPWVKLRELASRWASPRLGVLSHHPPIEMVIPRRYKKRKRIPGSSPPSISIVTPSFNQARYLPSTLESVLGQEYPALEYVVQDGGSQDGTVEVLGSYRDRLTSAVSAPDEGQSDALHKGFAKTSGEIMAYLNSDDLLLPGSLWYVARYFARHPEIDAVYGHRVLIDDEGREIGRWVLPEHDESALEWADYVPQETLFWRRRIWDEAGDRIDVSFRFAMDWDLLLRFQSAGARIVRLPRFLGAFRIHEQQKTSTAISHLGQREMGRLRRRCHGRDVSHEEIMGNLKTFLRRHVLLHNLYRAGVLRY